MYRRTFLSLAAGTAAACSKPKASGFPGYAFVANQEGQAIAVVDLSAFAVARHIAIDGKPSEVIAHPSKQSVYALTSANGTIHEIDSANLKLSRKLNFGQPVDHIRLSKDGQTIWALARNPHRLMELPLADWKVKRKVALPAEALDFDIAMKLGQAVISFGAAAPPHVYHLETLKLTGRLEGSAKYSVARFQSNSEAVMAGDRDGKLLSIFAMPSCALVNHLTLAVRPDYWCFKSDGGQLFLAGEGSEEVAIVYPYRTEVAETILAGHAPRGMTTVTTPDMDYLFVASPKSGDVTILNVETHKVIAVVAVGKNPGFLMPTPDNEFVLVLNQDSGDMAVIRIKSIIKNRSKSAPLFTMIPVGSKPVAAAVQSV